ncbi:MAG: hypothetical protein K8T20_11645 [Planctomycetes bacterium]|nr:hypothetical protein [Planctomycetota bacterium]
MPDVVGPVRGFPALIHSSSRQMNMSQGINYQPPADPVVSLQKIEGGLNQGVEYIDHSDLTLRLDSYFAVGTESE